MPIDPRLLDLDSLSPELRLALGQLLPGKLQRYLSKANVPASQQEELHTHLVILLSALQATAPNWLLAELASPPMKARGIEATLLFADVTAFTPITEALSRLGQRGNEELTNILNNFFTAMVRIATAWGGDVLAFGGDALLVGFSDANHAVTAAAAAWAMRAEMRAFDRIVVEGISEPFQLQMKIGMASGPLILAGVGRPDRRIALMLGSVLADTNAMADDLNGGEIRLDAPTAQALRSIAKLAFLQGGSAMLLDMPEMAPPMSAAAQDPSALRLSELAARTVALVPYLPYRVWEQVRANPRAAPGVGEQRQVISLFAHLDGLHALADAAGFAQADMLAQGVSGVFERAIAAIEQNHGVLSRVDSYAGGHKLLVLFGTPTAHERDAYLSVRGALALREAVDAARDDIAALWTQIGGQQRWVGESQPRIARDPPIRVRVGLNIGQVLAGLVGSLARYEYTVMGESVNVAARLMSAAELSRDEILLSAAVKVQIGAPLRATRRMLKLKGVSDLVEAWSVEELGPPLPRVLKLNTLVGRDREQQALQRAARGFLHNERWIVFLRGEAGIGKTRLSRELQNLVEGYANSVVIQLPFELPPGYALARAIVHGLYTRASATYKTIANWLDALDLQAGDISDVRVGLEFLLQRPGSDALGLGNNAEELQQRLARSVAELLRLTARQAPLALFVEDLHRADEQSLDLLARVFELTDTAWHEPLLICATLRWEPQQDTEDSAIKRLMDAARRYFGRRYDPRMLDPLAANAAQTLLDSLLPGLDTPIRAELLKRAAGNPLFLELLAENIERSGALVDGRGGRVLNISLDALDIPPDLSTLVVTLLDRLSPEAHRLACAAAVLGATRSSFDHWLLEKVLDYDPVIECWSELRSTQVIVADPPDQEASYVFRHPLFQQHAYELLPINARRALHRRIAAELEDEDPIERDQYINALAFHTYEGRDWERALEYSLAVGLRAQRSFDNAGARRYLRRALALARRLRRPREEAAACEGLGVVYTMMARFALARAHLNGALRRGALLEADPAQVQRLARRYRLLSRISAQLGDFARAEQDCRGGLELAANLELPNAEVARLYHQLAQVMWRESKFQAARVACDDGLHALPHGPATLYERVVLWLQRARIETDDGQYKDAIPVLRQSLKLARRMRNQVLIAEALYGLGTTFHHLGKPIRARICYQVCLAIREAIGDVLGRIEAFNGLGLVHWASGEIQPALECFAESIRLCVLLGTLNHQAVALTNMGQLQFELGRLAEARQHLHMARRLYRQVGNVIRENHCLYLLGDIALQQDHAMAALSLGRRTLRQAQQIDSPVYIACARRVIGEALVRHGRLSEADEQLDAAYEIQQEGDQYDLAFTLAVWAEVALAQGNIELARTRAERVLALAQPHDQNIPTLIVRMKKLLSSTDGANVN